jgi:transcription elongation factor Elf1
VTPRPIIITCKGCGEVIECPLTPGPEKVDVMRRSVDVPMKIDFGPVRQHHKATGHKVDGTPADFPTGRGERGTRPTGKATD